MKPVAHCGVKLSLVTETFPPEINGVALTNYRLAQSLVQAGHELELIRPEPDAGQGIGHTDGMRELRVRGWPVPFYPSVRAGHYCRHLLVERWRAAPPQIIHVATEGPLGLAALLAGRELGIPVSSTFHTNFHAYCRHYGLSFLRAQVLRYLRWFHNLCAVTLVPTAALTEELRELGFKRVKTLGRGVDRNLFRPSRRSSQLRAHWGADDCTPVVLCVSRVAREKNLGLVLEAFLQAQQRFPVARMVLVGDGPLLPRLRRRFPQVHFAGMRLDDDLAVHYASADLFYFASTTETFGNVILEAMASGLVVLSYDYAAARQHLRHRQSGMLVPYDQPTLFQEAACQLLERKQDWPAMARAAREATARAPWAEVTNRFECAVKRCATPRS